MHPHPGACVRGGRGGVGRRGAGAAVHERCVCSRALDTTRSFSLQANKQDLKDAMGVSELSEALGLPSIKTHSWHCQSSCAVTGEGLWEGLKWIADTLKHRQQAQQAA